ncbi:hypothetical protein HYPSUDRAFT_208899 [Hypholoma sublateritium FD-334 SS-4]|nr:hypothetical protein HYPSUDRAFT_208899 [Hypholoma sublateritium FD-334 SS-4]
MSNLTAATLRYATKKKLRPEQRDEVEAFFSDTVLGRQAKLFIGMMSLENKVDAFRSATPPYQLSEELKVNITNYGMAVMLSINIMGIEHDYANWEKISAYVSFSLTQNRSKVKKAIKASIVSDTNIFALAQSIVSSTPCRPTVQLCARVALMRSVFVECRGSEKYWNLIDSRLEFIRSKSDGSAVKIARGFTDILKNDRALYGAGEDYVIGDVIADEWQQRVDNVIGGAEDVAGA